MLGRRPDIMDAFTHEVLSVGASVVSLTASTYNPTTNAETGTLSNIPAQGALITVEGDAVRFYEDASSPSATDGHLVAVDGSVNVYGINNLRNFRVVAVNATATLRVTYYR